MRNLVENSVDKLFNKGFISITLINFVVYLVYYLLMVIIAVIAQDQLQATLGQAGLASGIYIIGTLLARLFMGKKLELIGRKSCLTLWRTILFINDDCLPLYSKHSNFIPSTFIKWFWLWHRFNSYECDCYSLYPRIKTW